MLGIDSPRLMPKQTTPLSEVSENVQKISLQGPSTKSQNCNRKPSNDTDKGILLLHYLH